MSRAMTMKTLDSLGRVLATEFEEQLDLVRFSHKGRVGDLAKLGRVKRPELASNLILAHPTVRDARVCPQLGDEHGRAAEIMFNLRGLALGDIISGPAATCPLLGDPIERAMPGLGLGKRLPGVDSETPDDEGLFREWQTEGIPSSWITASNGLQYKVVKMRHREVTERIGRGKIFDLGSLGDDARRGMRHALARHGTVCQRVRGKPGVPTNLTVCFSRDLTKWLIVDEWIEGDTLDLRIKQKTLDGVDTQKLLTRIARTLSHLHKAKVVRRELSPRFIILRADDFPILTDFELGKLFAGSRTVSNEAWKEDPYRPHWMMKSSSG